MTGGAEQSPPQGPPLRKILRTVARSDRLLQLWFQSGPEAVLADPDIAPDAARLTPDVRDALIAGDLCKIQEALDHEPHGEDTEAAVRPYWAIVRI
jgi:hypothetical protein